MKLILPKISSAILRWQHMVESMIVVRLVAASRLDTQKMGENAQHHPPYMRLFIYC